MKKEEYIKRYGEAAYEKMSEQNRERTKTYREKHREELNAAQKKYNEEHPEEVIATSQEQCRKGGKYYDNHLEYNQTGIQGERHTIRVTHARQWKPYKDIITPDSQIHHEWIPKTAEYRGVALVEAKPHQYGIIDVILILDGEITLLTEGEVKGEKEEMGKKL